MDTFLKHQETAQWIAGLPIGKRWGYYDDSTTYALYVRRPTEGEYELVMAWPVPERYADDYMSYRCGCPLQFSSHHEQRKSFRADQVEDITREFIAAHELLRRNRPVPAS